MQFETATGDINKKTIVEHFSEMLILKGLQPTPNIIEFEGVNFYPAEYFCPKPSEFRKIQITENTRTIHHYAASWIGPKQRFANLMIQIFGKKQVMKLYNLIK